MKTAFFILFLSLSAYATVPEPVITYKFAQDRHGIIAGKLSSRPESPVGITVDNGGMKYSTVTDREGNWAISFLLFSMRFEISSWSLQTSQQIGKSQTLSF